LKKRFTLYTILLTGLLLFLFFNCKKEDSKVAPTVSISAVTNITTTGASSGGDIISEGGMPVTAKGVCWSKNQNPTIADSKTNDGSGTGIFTSSITGLSPGVVYYIRAYAVNVTGTGYSSQSTFTTLATEPVLSTLQISAPTTTSFNSGGDISSNGGAQVTNRGICWSTQKNPTTADNKTTNGTGSGSFVSSVAGLIPGTIYYIRAYATNSVGTAYGNQLTAIVTNDSPVISDGSYISLQKATSGKGIDLVFMGDGYSAQEILSKKYENNLKLGYFNFFDIEPYKTYSTYFNVYMVYAISDQSGISDQSRTVNTKFETKFATGPIGTEMDINTTTCRTFTLKAPILDIENTVAIVVANSTQYGGTTYMHSSQSGFNVSICPINPTYFRNIVQHEAGGHGFGNLADEYVTNTSIIPQDQINILNYGHSIGMFMNVDLTNVATKTLWGYFIGLPNYNYVSAYQGGFLYSQGVWRPEDVSLMTSNIHYINAPGRVTIVKRIMSVSGSTYSFDEFQTKDVMELTPTTKAASLLFDKSLQLPPPVIMK